ncbi:MAG: hydroxyisourate hydrolase [Acidobacteriia bacterium]|nr:hydroxyisourate hydrolase [Terriglobia bacterium]
MIGISTHVLDTSTGQPVRGVRVVLERPSLNGMWFPEGEARTDSNGRISQFLAPGDALEEGIYRLTFYVGEYFEGQQHFYPEISVQFLVHDPSIHYHVPLLLSPYGYTTYRGS